jgi:acyl-CoA dehydrogenase
MDEHIYPLEPTYAPDHLPALQAHARAAGLWNLFLPELGLSNLEYAPLCEIMGRVPWAPEVFNCSPPDTGNMEVLALFGTPEQQEEWLVPLLEGRIRSAFAMTEPDVASSDATNISLSIERDGDEYVLNGRKWWISGAASDRCRILIVMGKTDPEAPRHLQQSMVLVPMDTPGLERVRDLPVFGYQDREGHCELRFTDVRVPATNLIGQEGSGFAIAQARLGPGRIHHCMRCIGVAERALDLMCERVLDRVAFGRPLAEQGVIREWIADSRIEIEQARLLTLKAAHLMDTVGAKGAAIEISAIKVVAPNTALRVVDRSIQAHGGAGVSDDFPLARMYAGLRTLRFADGPDEVHRRQVARTELARHAR